MINGSSSSEFKLTRGESIVLSEIMEIFLQEKRGYKIDEYEIMGT